MLGTLYYSLAGNVFAMGFQTNEEAISTRSVTPKRHSCVLVDVFLCVGQTNSLSKQPER